MRIHGLLARSATLHRHAVAITDDRRSVTFGELHQEVASLAGGLVAMGVRAGDRVAVLAHNRIEYAAFYFAAGRIGAALVPLNWRLHPAEVAQLLDDSRAAVVVADERFAPVIDRGADRLSHLRRRVALDVEADIGWEPPSSLAGPPLEEGLGTADEIVVQMYTSGTTGRPKGVMLSHRNLTSLTNAWLLEMPLRPQQDRFLQVTPLFHVGGLLMLLSTVARGSEMLLLPEFDSTQAAEALSERGVTSALFVPTMLRFLIDEPGVSEGHYPDLRMIAYGASAISPGLLRTAIDVFDCDFVQGYGLTETAGVLTALRPDDHRLAIDGREDLFTSAGRAVTCAEIRVVDDEDSPVPTGQTGELVARGDNITPGYWMMPEETREALRGGWFHTGDVGRMDEDGYVTIVDRKKDMIVSGGENVSPREVELILESHPAVREAAVIGIPHETWGERVHAVVEPARPGYADASALVSHCRESLAGFKCPAEITFVDELPHNAAGKLLKRELRGPWWSEQGRSV